MWTTGTCPQRDTKPLASLPREAKAPPRPPPSTAAVDTGFVRGWFLGADILHAVDGSDHVPVYADLRDVPGPGQGGGCGPMPAGGCCQETRGDGAGVQLVRVEDGVDGASVQVDGDGLGALLRTGGRVPCEHAGGGNQGGHVNQGMSLNQGVPTTQGGGGLDLTWSHAVGKSVNWMANVNAPRLLALSSRARFLGTTGGRSRQGRLDAFFANKRSAETPPSMALARGPCSDREPFCSATPEPAGSPALSRDGSQESATASDRSVGLILADGVTCKGGFDGGTGEGGVIGTGEEDVWRGEECLLQTRENDMRRGGEEAARGEDADDDAVASEPRAILVESHERQHVRAHEGRQLPSLTPWDPGEKDASSPGFPPSVRAIVPSLAPSEKTTSNLALRTLTQAASRPKQAAGSSKGAGGKKSIRSYFGRAWDGAGGLASVNRGPQGCHGSSQGQRGLSQQGGAPVFSPYPNQGEAVGIWQRIYKRMAAPKCSGHGEEAVARVVKKEGANRGRTFFAIG
eukprot:jgi/Mesvir1/27749/Mv07439-RA.1